MKNTFKSLYCKVKTYFVPEIFQTVREIAFKLPTVIEKLPEIRKKRNFAICWLILSEICLVAQLYPVKKAVDAWQNGAGIGKIALWCAGISVGLVLGSLVGYKTSCARVAFTDYVGAVLWAEAHRKQLSMDTEWHVENGTGDKESIILRNTERAQIFFESYLFEALRIKLRITCTIAGMFFINWIFGALAVLIFSVYSWLLARIEPVLTPLSQDHHEDLKVMNVFGSELNQNCLTIKAMGLEKYFSDINWEKLNFFFQKQIKRYPIWRRMVNQPEQCVNLSKGAVYFTGMVLGIYTKAFTYGSFLLVTGWMERILSSMYNLIEFQEKSRRGEPAITELADLFRIEPRIKNSLTPVKRNTWQGKVEFRNVKFGYSDSSGPTLKGIDLVVEPYTMVGIVGKTGCGKSTLLKLLQRLYDPDLGEICIDGVNLKDIDYDHYRQQVVGVVQQHIQLFQMTVRQNIRLSRLDALPGEEVQAANLAYADEFINKLPDGYDYLLGEDGKQLSGGQRQRLGIARALHGKPRILILDEPTSSLDSESQLRVQLALDELMKRRACTTFVIAHRFSTIRNADLIVVMDEGQIVEIGTHNQLLEMNGFYARLLRLDQEGGFASE